jgi:formiminoglutamase
VSRVFDRLESPPEDVYFSRDDPNDVRLGDIVVRGVENLKAATPVALLGCTQDEGVRRNRGRLGARRAPLEIRRALYRFPVTTEHAGLRLVDLGDLPLLESLEATHDVLREVVGQVLHHASIVVVLGGGNDISYPDVAALAGHCRQPLALNVDRHLDVRADRPRNSGTPYRQLLEEGLLTPERFVEVGINSFANSPSYREWVDGLGVRVVELAELRERGVGAAVEALVRDAPADAVFFGFDMDVVRAVEAPGVSDPSPMGLTAREVCEIADVAAREPRTRVLEITEVNPDFDRDGITARLAANLVMRALARPGVETQMV